MRYPVNDLHQKYAKVKSLRRSGWISNILLYKILGWKLSVFFPNSLYSYIRARLHDNSGQQSTLFPLWSYLLFEQVFFLISHESLTKMFKRQRILTFFCKEQMWNTFLCWNSLWMIVIILRKKRFSVIFVKYSSKPSKALP